MKIDNRNLLQNMDTIPCRKCLCKDFEEIPVDWMENIILEARVVCKNCGHIVNYYVAGYYENPDTFTKLFSYPLKDIINYIRYESVI